jgi:hypothetical protein
VPRRHHPAPGAWAPAPAKRWAAPGRGHRRHRTNTGSTRREEAGARDPAGVTVEVADVELLEAGEAPSRARAFAARLSREARQAGQSGGGHRAGEVAVMEEGEGDLINGGCRPPFAFKRLSASLFDSASQRIFY